MRSISVLLALLAGCSTNLEVPSGADIACASDDDCPEGLKCHSVLLVCLSKDVEVPAPRVTFVAPRNGESRVSVTPTLVVAFSLDVDADSAAAHVHLTAPDAEEVPLAAAATETANTVAFVPVAPLKPLTTYSFAVGAGVAPAKGVKAVPGAEDFSSAFTTAEAPDRTPPAPVTEVLVDRTSGDRAVLRWTNPTDSDLAGVLIVRKAGALQIAQVGDARGPDAPTQGVTYATGATVGGAEVVGSVRGATATDVTVDKGTAYDYAFFAFDESSNYSPGVRVPFVTRTSLSWCPTETGSFQLESADPGTAQLRLAGGADYPATAAKLGEVVAIAPGGDLQLGQTYTVYGAAKDGLNVALGVPQTLVLSRAGLEPLKQPVAVSLGGTATFEFTPYGWPEIEAEVDTDPRAAADTPPADDLKAWVPAQLTANAATAKIASAGTFRFRVRPRVAGCAVASWVLSDEFKVGSGVLLYVSTTGDDAKSGLDPQSALKTLGKALALATPGTDIHVATGTYAEQVVLKPGVRLIGGYSPDFREQDGPLLTADVPPKDATGMKYTTTIASPDVVAVKADGGGITNSAVLEGFTVKPNNGPSTCPSGASCQTVGVLISNGAAPTIRGNDVFGGTPASNQAAFGVHIVNAGGVKIVGNRIEGVNAGPSSRTSVSNAGVGVQVDDCKTGSTCEVSIQHNRIVAHVGIETGGINWSVTQGGVSYPSLRLRVEDNGVEGDPGSLNDSYYPQPAVAFYCAADSVDFFSGNVLRGRPNNTAFSAQMSNSGGVVICNCRVGFARNVIDGGDGFNSRAVSTGCPGGLPGAPHAYFVANVITGGSGQNAFVLAESGDNRPLVFANNTIDAGGRSGGNVTVAPLGGQGGVHGVSLVNNLLYGAYPWTFLQQSYGYAKLVKNNVVLAPAPKTYFTDPWKGTFTTVAPAETAMGGQGTATGGNALLSLTATSVFKDAARHLATTDTAITQGGIDALAAIKGAGYGADGLVCPGIDADICAAFGLDKDGTPRSATPFSVGAY